MKLLTNTQFATHQILIFILNKSAFSKLQSLILDRFLVHILNQIK